MHLMGLCLSACAWPELLSRGLAQVRWALKSLIFCRAIIVAG